MNLTSFVNALPPSSNTGWGTASQRISEELAKISVWHDFRDGGGSDLPLRFSVPVLHAAQGVSMLPFYQHLRGTAGICYCFVEDDILLQRYIDNGLLHYKTIVCGSRWAADTMNAAIKNACNPQVPFNTVKVAVQGVDSHIFKPMPGLRDIGKFTIWSAGKFEFRKGQDVVIRAVKTLMDQHPEIRLMASWWNPWPQSAMTMQSSNLIEFNGDIMACVGNYLDMSRVTLLPPMKHAEAVPFINQCDVALFPNRCEAGTNLPLMEAMACGLPVIATAGHGHATVLGDANVVPIEAKPFVYSVNGIAHGNWREPYLEKVVSALELVYGSWNEDAGALPRAGLKNREAISKFTWEACAKALLGAIENV